MDKKRIFALLLAATILTTVSMATNPPTTIRILETQTHPTMNPTTTPLQTTWNKTYGGTGNDRALSVQQTSDGGYIMAGYTNSFGAGLTDFWLVKTDSAGNHQWNKTYGGTGSESAGSVWQTSDGGYVFAGITTSFGIGGQDIWLVKTDANGNHQWNKTYGGTGIEGLSYVQQTSDGGYVLAGSTNSFGAGGLDFWLVKTNSTGNHQWNKTYGGTGIDAPYSVQQTPDGGYILLGLTTSFGAGSDDFWLVKTDASGNHQWNKTYGGTGGDDPASVRQTSDGGYISSGKTSSFGAGGTDLWLVKTDASGNLQWNKTYGGTGNDAASSVQQIYDGGYMMAGCTDSFGVVGNDAWLVKTDSAGNLQWNKTYGGTGNDWVRSLRQTSDGGYVLAGQTSSFGAVLDDFWLMKTGDATPPSMISNLAAGTPTSNSVTLTWTAPGDEWNTGTATGYVVKWSATGPITDANWSSATTYTQSWTPLSAGNTETRTVSGLNVSTRYWFAIKAYDEIPYYGACSNSPNATTTSAAAGGLPVNMIVVGVVAIAIIGVVVFIAKRRK